MADATINVVNRQVVVQPFGSDALVPLVGSAASSATAAAQSALDATTNGAAQVALATDQATIATAAAATASSVSYVNRILGPGTATGTATSSGFTDTLIESEPFDADGVVDGLDLWVMAIGAGNIVVKLATRNSDGTVNYKSTLATTTLNSATGANAINWTAVAVSAGDYICIRRAASTAATLAYSNGDGGSSYQVIGDLTGTNVAASASAINLHYRVRWRATAKATDNASRMAIAEAAIGSKATIPTTYSYGRVGITPATTNNAKDWWFPGEAIGHAFQVKRLKFRNIPVAGIMQFAVLAPENAAGTSYTCLRRFECRITTTGAVTLSAGTDFDAFIVDKGYRVAFIPVTASFTYYSSDAGGYQYTANLMPGQTGIVLASVGFGMDLEVVGEGPAYVTSLLGEKMGERLRGSTTIHRQLFAGTSTPTNWSIGTWTVNTGLVSPATAGWDKIAKYTPTNFATRRFDGCIIRVNTASTAIKVLLGRDTSQGGGVMFNAATNKLELYTWGGGAGAGTLIDSVDTGFTAPIGTVAGRRYSLRWQRRNFRVRCILTDLTTQQSCSLDCSRNGNTGITAKGSTCVSFVAGSGSAGDVTIELVETGIDVAKNPHYIQLGDSNSEKTALGLLATASYAELVNVYRNKGDVLIAAQHGGTSAGVAANIAWLPSVAGANTIVGINIGTNDTALATWRTNMATIIEAIVAAGAQPLLFTLAPKTGGIYLSANADIRSYYFGAYPYVDACSALTASNDLTNWNAAYDSGDGVHWNGAGNTAIFEQIKADAPFLLYGGEGMMW